VTIGQAGRSPQPARPDPGAFLWSYTAGSTVFSSPAVASGVVYTGSNDGKVYAFDLGGGSNTVRRPEPSALRADLNLRLSD
jgi:outer membrane protein assembly factor BamB